MKKIYMLTLFGLMYTPICAGQDHKLVELASKEDKLNAYAFNGVKYFERKNYTAAYSSFKSAFNRAKIDNKAIDTCAYHLGVTCLRFNHLDSWREGLELLLSIKNPNAFKNYWENLAIAYILNNQYENVLSALDKGNELLAFNWFLRGIVSMKENRYIQADQAFDKARNMGLAEDANYFLLAEAKHRVYGEKSIAPVLELLDKAAKYSQEKANLAAAIVYSQSGDNNRAQHLIESLNSGDTMVLYVKALVFFNSRKDFLAKKALINLVSQRPRFSAAHLLLGHVLIREASRSNNMALFQEGVRHYDRAISIAPELPAYYEARALALFSLVDAQSSDSDISMVGAIADFARIREIEPTYEFAYEFIAMEARAWHMVYRSMLYQKRPYGDFELTEPKEYLALATDRYEKAMAKGPASQDLLESLAALKWDADKHGAALGYFLQASQIGKSETNQMGVAMAYYKTENYSKARQFFQTAREMNPTNPIPIMGLGLVQLQSEEIEGEGIKLMEQAYSMVHTISEGFTRGILTFNYAFAKTYDFKNSNYPQNQEGFEAYAQKHIRPIYEEAQKLTGIVDSSIYFVNFGWYAEKLRFLALAKKYYGKSSAPQSINNAAVLLARNDNTAEAIAMLEGIQDQLQTARNNLNGIKENKQHCPCIKSLSFTYFPTTLSEKINLTKMTDLSFPANKAVIQPLADLYAFEKPKLSKKYPRSVTYRRTGPTDCPRKFR